MRGQQTAGPGREQPPTLTQPGSLCGRRTRESSIGSLGPAVGPEAPVLARLQQAQRSKQRPPARIPRRRCWRKADVLCQPLGRVQPTVVAKQASRRAGMWVVGKNRVTRRKRGVARACVPGIRMLICRCSSSGSAPGGGTSGLLTSVKGRFGAQPADLFRRRAFSELSRSLVCGW
jgi:hypothetical protein